MPLRRATLLAAGCLTLCGCGKGTKEPATPALPVAERPNEPPAKDAPAPPVVPVPKPAVPPVRPSDLAARTVTKALMPRLPAAPEPATREGPRPRVSAVDRGEMPLPTVGAKALPPSRNPTGKPPRLSPPPDGVPKALGDAAAVGVGALPLPDRPLLKGTSAANPGATDVPAMARQRPDRASVEDPTVAASAKAIVETPLPLPAGERPYRKEVIPNPFALAEQLKGKLGRETELGTAPVVVPPGRK